MKPSVNIFWFRRDLRLTDNAGLYHALKSDLPVLPIFIFDKTILDKLENKTDARVEFIYDALQELQKKLLTLKSSLEVYYGKPAEVYASLMEKYKIAAVLTNEDYEPYARERDGEIEKLLKTKGIAFHMTKDQVIFSRDEVMKEDKSPYTVFTPYYNKWSSKLHEKKGFYLKPYPIEKYLKNLFKQSAQPFPNLGSMGFQVSDDIASSANSHKRTANKRAVDSGFLTSQAEKIKFPSSKPDEELIEHYAKQRDFPGLNATTRMGIHLRFGTISIRKLAAEAEKLSSVYLKELVWREFYQMILWHFPKVGEGHTFKPAYEKIKWINNENEFSRWCEGKTGYPLVDAGMRQLNETGFMHNRVRMVTASFLSKHLLIDWRWGEAYFAEKLLDYDLASNNGGWQWAAGSGCDAAPYFRIFNPTLQQKKFDPDGSYIKKWLPDYQELTYPAPIVEHSFARDRCIKVYQQALNQS